ncbi:MULTISPECIES: hypothetical protein [unclassified Streptomyces]|uniref:hypothetical protein n=1 Tax=unclassified Streptomyces TaxID=2593676 RepID=UPI00039CD306|nr:MULTISPECIES: hypothetical protein [unclassified Streptomyces]MYT29577.1 hypothetical protein [Streptomyces sp. SID8354]
MAEAGFFPGVVAYLTTWLPTRQRTRALAAFLLAVPVATAVGLPPPAYWSSMPASSASAAGDRCS